MLRVIAITGKRFSGKDSLARALGLPTFAFADESKRMLAARNPDVDLARLMTDRAYKESVRRRLTALTVAELAADPLVFVRAVCARITEPSVISDLRLRHERAFLEAAFDTVVVRVQRSDANRALSGWVYSADKDEHVTETDLDDPSLWDHVVDNNGSLAELDQAARILRAT